MPEFSKGINGKLLHRMIPPLIPIPIKERLSIVFVEKGNLDVLDGAFVWVDKNGVRTHLPIGGIARKNRKIGTATYLSKDSNQRKPKK